MNSATQSRGIAFVIAAALFVQMLDSVIITTALPVMAADFGVVPLQTSIGVTAYMLTTAIFIPLAGWMADRLGARRVFLWAILLFTLSSIGCGLAQDLPQFLIARGVQGIGGAFMMPVGRLIVLRNAPKAELVRSLATITWPVLIAPVVGPALGGFITAYFSWRWNFLINVPLGLLGYVLVALVVPANDETIARKMDWPGFLLSAIGLSALLCGFETIIHAEDQPAIPLVLAGVGVVFCLLTLRHMRRTATPLLDLSPLDHQTFAIAHLFAGTAVRMAVNATPFLLPLLFQIGFGLDPLQAGGLTAAYFAGNLAMKTVTTPILKRFGFRSVMVVNGVLAAISIALCAALLPETPYALTLFILFAAGLTRSMQFTALNTIGFADIEASQRSSASTLSSMLQQVSVVVGVALAAALLNVSQALAGRGELALADFQLAFIVMGLLSLVSALRMLTLEPDAGMEVSGHRPAVG